MSLEFHRDWDKPPQSVGHIRLCQWVSGIGLQGRLDFQAGTAVNEGSGCRAVSHSTDWEMQWTAN